MTKTETGGGDVYDAYNKSVIALVTDQGKVSYHAKLMLTRPAHHDSSFVGRRWVRLQFQLLQGTEHCIADAVKIDLEALEAEEAAVLRTTTRSSGLEVMAEELGQRGHSGDLWLFFMNSFLTTDSRQTDGQSESE